MGRTVTVETYVNIDVELEDIHTDDLVEELESRGRVVDGGSLDLLKQIYQLRRIGKSFDHELDHYLSEVLGIVV